ncbi:hypothetical protein [Streptomyces sp. NBC_01089]|uniref:hypothetical protein n=1 Tax=Streptomyces sp. NBC_01089 TaxID=2903747 RepID=UPI00386D3675|nr:hypothetical protein OG510_32705 [Streptomyces sp. NBC_01089]
MTGSRADSLMLLRELDDPNWLERPREYDRNGTAVLFDGLVKRLEGDFSTQCATEQDTQDSSEYGRVVVPAEATTCGTRVVVCVSKFGSLAFICADNPGAFLGTDEAQAEGHLHSDDLRKVSRALDDLAYAVLPEELVESDYDGPSQLPWHVQRPSWWHRFFGTF